MLRTRFRPISRFELGLGVDLHFAVLVSVRVRVRVRVRVSVRPAQRVPRHCAGTSRSERRWAHHRAGPGPHRVNVTQCDTGTSHVIEQDLAHTGSM